MKKASAVRSAVATLFATAATVAQAAGDSGTEAMGEMTVTGTQFAMMIGGLGVLGVVIWGVTKIMK
jgi:hypothetical protein